MSENREAFNDWVNTLNEKLLNKGNSINNNCKANTKSSTNFFYLKFGDTLASYDPMYIVSPVTFPQMACLQAREL